MYKTIDFAGDPHRQKHFEFFRKMDQPHFSITAPVEIDALLAYLKAQAIPLTPALVFLVSNTINALPAFRQRIRGEAVIEHDLIHPSFTVKTEASSVFSFCYVDFHPNADSFIPACVDEIAAMQKNPSFENEDGRDDFIYLSALPWIPFTNLQHAMHYSPVDSVPRIAWGKYTPKEGKMHLPVQIQAHHALVDGIDMGRFFETLQSYCSQPQVVFQ